MAKVFVSKLADRVEDTVCRGLDWINVDTIVPRNARVAIKPNLTYPFHKPGVTTSPRLLEAVVAVLRTRTRNISIVESDGGSYSWPARQAFEGHGILDICKRYEVSAVNLTESPREWVETEVAQREVRLEMSRLLLRETDVFVTMPVPKVHAMTRVSLGFKNQWGCLPDVKRLRNHPEFSRKVIALNRLLGPKMVIFDGTWFLNRQGPMEGEPVRMDLVIASNDVGAGSLACCELMGIAPESVAHLRLAAREGMMPHQIQEVELNTDLHRFAGPRFYLDRGWSQWLALAIFHSRLATKMLYDSPLAKPAHEALYLFRGKPKDFAPKW